MSVGVAVADDEVLVITPVVLVVTLLVLNTTEEVLLGIVVPTVEHAVPKRVASLNVSANAPLPTPYFKPVE